MSDCKNIYFTTDCPALGHMFRDVACMALLLNQRTISHFDQVIVRQQEGNCGFNRKKKEFEIFKKWWFPALQDNPIKVDLVPSNVQLPFDNNKFEMENSNVKIWKRDLTDKYTFFGNTEVASEFRKKFIRQFSLIDKPKSSLIQILIIQRSQKRLFEGLEILYDKINSEQNYKVIIENFDNISYEDQINQMFHADIVIMGHGAAMVNLVAMRKDCTLIEIFPYDFEFLLFNNLAIQFGIKHNQLWGGKTKCTGGDFAVRRDRNIILDDKTINSIMEKIS